jgi:PAS domain S-box-containing protein
MSIDTLASSSDIVAALARPDYQKVLDALPAAVYATDSNGTITFFNRAAEQMAGRTPVIGIDKWCITHRLYRPDGTFLPHDQCPMAVALREARPVRNVEIVVERPDGHRVPAMPFPTPIFDEDGELSGAVNLIVDIGQLKHAETDAARRAEEQAALYQFTDKLYRASGLDDIYSAALEAILGGLDCDRASILLFDAGGTMRFAASSGLSEAYRKAVDGHSPWRPGDTDPAPILIDDILTSDQPDALRRIVAGEGIRGLGFIPLVADGVVIGKFMSYHDEPHRFTDNEVALAVTIARQLGFAIARHRTETARQAAEEEVRKGVERLRLATQAGKVGLWDWDIAADRIAWTDSIYAMHGIERDQFSATFEDWVARVHPDDRERVRGAVRRTIEEGAPYDLELRAIRPDGGHTWLYAHANVLRSNGRPVRMVGASVDITERKQSEAERELLLAELSHRVKNTLATVISIAHQSFADQPGFADARRRFESRIRALAQTHTRLAESSWSTVGLKTMLSDELAPYGNGENIAISGHEVGLRPRQAIMLGMGFHELATNAAKYGALSSTEGRVAVSWQQEGDELQISWRESGGPVTMAPSRTGFGRILLERALAAELRGKVAMDFDPAGLHCTIRIPLDPERS